MTQFWSQHQVDNKGSVVFSSSTLVKCKTCWSCCWLLACVNLQLWFVVTEVKIKKKKRLQKLTVRVTTESQCCIFTKLGYSNQTTFRNSNQNGSSQLLRYLHIQLVIWESSSWTISWLDSGFYSVSFCPLQKFYLFFNFTPTMCGMHLLFR